MKSALFVTINILLVMLGWAMFGVWGIVGALPVALLVDWLMGTVLWWIEFEEWNWKWILP